MSPGAVRRAAWALAAALSAAIPAHAWPPAPELLRALDGLGLPVRRTDSGSILDEPCDARPDLFPETTDTARLLPRIGTSLPVHDLDRLHYESPRGAR